MIRYIYTPGVYIDTRYFMNIIPLAVIFSFTQYKYVSKKNTLSLLRYMHIS